MKGPSNIILKYPSLTLFPLSITRTPLTYNWNMSTYICFSELWGLPQSCVADHRGQGRCGWDTLTHLVVREPEITLPLCPCRGPVLRWTGDLHKEVWWTLHIHTGSLWTSDGLHKAMGRAHCYQVLYASLILTEPSHKTAFINNTSTLGLPTMCHVKGTYCNNISTQNDYPILQQLYGAS